jgi:flagellar motor switch protein FliG
MASTPQVAPQENRAAGGFLLPIKSGFAASGIPGLRKAAILMVAVGDDLAKVFFQSLSQYEVQQVTDEITRLGDVSQAQLTQILTEFYGLLETQQYVVRGGLDYARRLLTDAFGQKRAEEMLVEVQKMRERTNGDLAMLQKMDPQQLSKFLENEHPQTVALVLAHLDAKRGSTLLMNLGERLRVESVRRLAEMRQFSPEMAQKVALILHRRMEALGSTGRKSYAGFKAVADLLNRLDHSASKKILEEIEQGEPKLAIGIRNLMFTFEDLLTVSEQSIRELVAAADKRILALALRGSNDNLRAHLMKAMSSRAAEMMRDDMDVLGPVGRRDVSSAQQDLLVLARSLEAQGKMTLKLDADDELAV